MDQLEEMGLSYELWFGVNGRNGLPEHFETLIDRLAAHRNVGRPMADSEFACALSHNQIYQNMVAQGLAEAIILEDDVTIDDRLLSLFDHLTHPPCDLLLLGHSKGRVSPRNVVRLSDNFLAYKILMAPYGTTGYFLTKSAAELLIKQSQKISNVADWPCDITTLNSRVIMPRLCNHSEEAVDNSTIQVDRAEISLSSSFKRLLKLIYWKRWLVKRLGKRLE